MEDFCPIRRVDHLELWVGNAHQAAHFYTSAFGFVPLAYRGLETGSRETTSRVLGQGRVRLVLTAALDPDHAIARRVHEHGDGVGVIALEVPDVAHAFAGSVERGAEPAFAPVESRDEHGVVRRAGIRLYGDTVLAFVERAEYRGVFAPGFVAMGERASARERDGGLRDIDHVVGNVELGAMDRWVEFFERVLGFRQLVHFDDEAISTEYSALMSKVMQDGSGRIKFPINEPAQGRRKSQIAEYLEYNRGPGVQHIAFATGDIIATVSGLRARGVEFLRVPSTYYEDLTARVGPLDEPIDRLRELGILADRDEDGYLLQIFTKPIVDRPTLFFEIIERHGANGFGAGNFKSLFEAIEREQELRGNL